MINFGAGAKIGLIVGILGGVIGLGAAIIAPLAVGDYTGAAFGGGMAVLFVVIFGGVFYKVLKPIYDQHKLVTEGTPAKGEILEIQDTGVTLNNAPQIKVKLKVIPQVGSEYETELKTFVSRINPNMFMPGQTVDVMVSKTDKMKVAILPAGSVGAAAGGINAEELKTKLMDSQALLNDVLVNGVSSSAIVIDYKSLGANVNGNNPAVELKLKVTPESEPAFEATTIGVIAEASVPKFQPGEEIFVKYDVSDKSKVVIEHS